MAMSILPPARHGRLLTRACTTCQTPTAKLKRGRCDACYAYSYKYGH